MKKVSFAYWNDNNTTLPTHDVWAAYDGVWHLKDVTDSSNAQRNATTEGSVSLEADGIIGEGLSLSSAGNLLLQDTKEYHQISQEL